MRLVIILAWLGSAAGARLSAPHAVTLHFVPPANATRMTDIEVVAAKTCSNKCVCSVHGVDQCTSKKSMHSHSDLASAFWMGANSARAFALAHVFLDYSARNYEVWVLPVQHFL